MNAISLRQAIPSDVEAMLEVWRASDEDGGPERRREVSKVMERHPDLVVVAGVDCELVGVILGTTDGLWGLSSSLGYEHEEPVTVWVKTLETSE